MAKRIVVLAGALLLVPGTAHAADITGKADVRVQVIGSGTDRAKVYHAGPGWKGPWAGRRLTHTHVFRSVVINERRAKRDCWYVGVNADGKGKLRVRAQVIKNGRVLKNYASAWMTTGTHTYGICNH